MAIPGIFKSVLGWLGDFSAVFVADKVSSAEKSSTIDRTTALMQAAQKVMDAEKFNRPEFLLELGIINARTKGEVKPILDLFDEFWRNKGVIFVGSGKERRSYRENQIGHLLQEIPVEQRQTEYVRLARLLSEDRRKFFAQLEMLNNDRLQQYARQFMAEIEDSQLGKSIAATASELAEPLEAITGDDGSLRNLRDRLRARATGRR